MCTIRHLGAPNEHRGAVDIMVTASRDLSAKNRESDLGALGGGELDVLVVGGGVVGAGIARDAATRGLSVGLVEAQDWASGTSSRSTKLIHGGLRYLQMFDFYLVHEALRERGLLLERIAPHLVTKMSFLYPLRHRCPLTGVRRRPDKDERVSTTARRR